MPFFERGSIPWVFNAVLPMRQMPGVTNSQQVRG
jgi:hypothetical protein